MRSLRREEREITDAKTREELLARAAVCRLGFSAAEGVCDYPYVVPLHFAHHDRTIYLHCASAGLKLDLLARDPRVCVEVDELSGIVPGANPCSFSARYTSLIAFGRARLATEPAVKRRALSLLTEKYAHIRQDEESWTDPQVDSVTIVVVQIEHLTAKRAPRP